MTERASRVDQVKGFVADLARPFAIISTSAAAAWATVDIAQRVNTGEGGAVLLGVVFGGLSALYVGKAFEVTRIAGHTAEVEKARVASMPPPGTAQITAAPDVDVTVREAVSDNGELPLNQRVKL